jgi:hypothetical protein
MVARPGAIRVQEKGFPELGSFLHLASEPGKLREPIIEKLLIGEPSELVDSFGRWTQHA